MKIYTMPNLPFLRLQFVALIGLLVFFLMPSCRLERLPSVDCLNPPKASFTMDTTACETPCTIKFTNTSQGAITFTWVFGNGNLSNRMTPPPQYYIQGGIYNIVLTAENEVGCKDTALHQVLVKKTTNYPLPAASFTSDKLSGRVPCTIVLNNNSTGATEYLWNFGDGTPSVKPSDPATITHTFRCSGRFPVSLTASNPKWSHTDTLWIDVTTETFTKPITYQGLKTQVNVIRPTPDGGYILAGYVQISSDNKDAWLLKMDALGNTLWERPYDYSREDEFKDVQVVNGQYVAIGTSTPAFLKDKIVFARFDNNGQSIGSPKIIENPNETSTPFSLLVNTSGEVVIAGIGNLYSGKNQCFFVLKLNAQGDPIWISKTDTLKSRAPRPPVRLIRNNSGEYVFSGYRMVDEQGNNNSSMMLGNITNDGQMKWFNAYKPLALDVRANDVKLLPNGAYIIAGDGRVKTSDYDLYMVKVNNAGTPVDERLIKKAGTSEYIKCIEILPNDQYMILGDESVSSGNYQTYMSRIDWSGQTLWKKNYAKDGAYTATFLHPVTSDCGYIMVLNDFTNGRALIIKTDAEGNTK